jgi:hypothetical protein
MSLVDGAVLQDMSSSPECQRSTLGIKFSTR